MIGDPLPNHTVTDHALLRYIERVMGVDLETIRDNLARDVLPFALSGCKSMRRDGMVYHFAEGRLITVIPVVKPQRGTRAYSSRRDHGADHDAY